MTASASASVNDELSYYGDPQHDPDAVDDLETLACRRYGAAQHETDVPVVDSPSDLRRVRNRE
jgi:hypothetical protein